MTKNFCVVNFTEEGRFAVVPSAWVDLDKQQCYWPDKKTKNKSKLQRDPSSVPTATWTCHDVTIKKYYGKLLIVIYHHYQNSTKRIKHSVS